MVVEPFLIRLGRKTSYLTSTYISICLTAWILNPVVPKSYELFSFLIFSIILLISSIIVPVRPYVKKIQLLKENALAEVDEKIQQEYKHLLDQMKADDNNDLSRINSLIEMRKKIEDIQSYPFKTKTLTASLSIIFISLLPVLIDFVLQRFYK